MESKNFNIRKASADDCEYLMQLITELAIYEKAENEVVITADTLRRDGFSDDPMFYVIVAERENEIIGMALYYFKYSTWKGKCMFLEDLVVKENERGNGIGGALFEEIVKISTKEKVLRMEWQVLDWNEPAIHFYKKYDAELDPEWLNGRFYDKDLKRLNETLNLGA